MGMIDTKSSAYFGKIEKGVEIVKYFSSLNSI